MVDTELEIRSMKFENSKMKISALVVLIIVVGSLGLYSYANRGATTQSGETYLFVKPAFAQSMSTAPTFLDEEAGISLYVNISRSIDLSVARTVYRTMEKETADYIIGSVGLPGLSSDEDVHCFVHKDGWIVTYYLKEEPISKIVDWNLWSQGKLTKNKLQIGLEQMTNALGALATTAKYYDFQYPNATTCMIILKTLVGSGEESFNVTIPGDIAVYERSWSHYAQSTAYYGIYYSYFKIDGNTVDSISGISNPVTNRGTLIVAQLIPDATHIVSISGAPLDSDLYGVCIGLVYQEP
jgi:hypothetical protein